MKQPKRLGVLTQSRAYNHAPVQEREAAKRLGGRTTPASGSLREKVMCVFPAFFVWSVRRLQKIVFRHQGHGAENHGSRRTFRGAARH